jgi:hypothetical protein
MKKMCKSIAVLMLPLLLGGCGAMMKDVMRECDRGQNFDSYAYCIKSTYSQKGNKPNDSAIRAFYSHLDINKPNDSAIRAFYSHLDMISEAYRANKITDAQAKSYAYDAFMKTVQASNDRADTAFMNYMGTQQMLQQQQQQIRTPVQTNCIRNGQYTNCTSY